MIRYQVRSKELIDLANEIKSKRLILSPYFQRNLVWREIHKVDFIRTILMGFPIPQIFVAKGSIDLESMTTTSCIVDGQQRMSSIVEFINNKFQVDSRFFNDLEDYEQESFLKYQVPIIDLDIDNEDPDIKEIFQRLNRTFYSLNAIEKLSSEFASSEFMLVSKHLTGEILFDKNDDEDSSLLLDPSIPEDFTEWAKGKEVSYFKSLIIESGIFTPYEISRQIHLMYSLNLMATNIGGIYTRNDLATRYLDELKEDFSQKSQLIEKFENTSKYILDLDLDPKSYWLNKSNMFSLFSFLATIEDFSILGSIGDVRDTLTQFESDVPADYQIAAKEGVNNRKERLIRNKHIDNLLLPR
ncbi:DUF262 domain-containing protein [Neptuniibacter sp. QD48_11]|uniref:DUF262 domain-containing protein n=1 Tax=unclassified Neptuniibacter TaxID=2630693 RepID=UPI0039F531C0